ncbi:MAG TPA: serine hydrolase [Chitinophagaceae bacterium]|nr:serine hydrolase [Chitinophagaceae bacterium]
MKDNVKDKADTIKITGKTENVNNTKTSPFLEDLLQQYPQYFDDVLQKRKSRNVQIIYTEINRDDNNNPAFTDYFFNVDSSQYFYPASTVKLPTALLALQKLRELQNTGITKSTTMITEDAYSGQTAAFNDPQTPDGRPNIESYIKKIFLVSDNNAFNRLYEFLGQEYVNEQLHKKGYTDAQIIHRLEIFLSEDENRHTNPVKFLDSNNNILYSQPLLFNETKYAERHDALGKAYYKGGQLVNTPMNFSKKNRISLEDLHNILRSVIFPKSVPGNKRFNLTDSDYAFVLQYMSQFPGETIYPFYDSANYPDAYGKFLLYGSQKEPLSKNIRIFNKEGDAYGELIDIAYIIDFDKNIEFFLSAAINCNTNEIVNDDIYDYDSVGFPFMKNLGQVIYDYELKRKRLHKPDFSSFKITYDK